MINLLYYLLKLPPVLSLFLISFIISFLVTLVYKYLTNQELMRSIKEELKDLQKLSREAQKVGDTKKMREISAKTIKKNMLYMKHSMNSTLITFLPLLLVYYWLAAHYSYMPLMPNSYFNTTLILNNYSGSVTASILSHNVSIIGNATKLVKNNTVTFVFLPKKEGKYLLLFKLNNATDKTQNEVSENVIISNAYEYEKPIKDVKENGYVKKIVLSNKPLMINLGINMSWFWVYLIFSMFTNYVVRKILNVY